RSRTPRTTARWAQQWNVLAQDPQDWLDLAGTLRSHCAAVGRDPGEITCSVNIRVEHPAGTEQAAGLPAAYRDAGVDLAIMTLPLDAEPGILVPMAEA